MSRDRDAADLPGQNPRLPIRHKPQAPLKLRLRIFSWAGRIVRGGRRLRLRLAASWPCATCITAAITRLQVLAPS
jgi:hypothetical protein